MPERSAVAEPRDPFTKTRSCVAIRPEKVKLSRRGPASDAANAHAINRLEGVVTDVSYLGGTHHLQGQARHRRGAALVDGQYRAARRRCLSALASAWWPGSRRTIAWCWSNERAPHLRAPGAPCRDRALSVDGAVLPGAVRLRPEDQPVADRDRAAALCAGVRSERRGSRRSRPRSPRCRSTISGCWSPTISMCCPICAASSSRRSRPRSCS